MKRQKQNAGKIGPPNSLEPRVLKRHNDDYTIRGVYADRILQTVHVDRSKLARLRFDDSYPHHNGNEVLTNTGHTALLPVVAVDRQYDEAAIMPETEQMPQYNFRSRGI